jgi:hypothetical protein
MSIPDALMPAYFESVTDVPMAEVLLLTGVCGKE